jgi:hypothetical protein
MMENNWPLTTQAYVRGSYSKRLKSQYKMQGTQCIYDTRRV